MLLQFRAEIYVKSALLLINKFDLLILVELDIDAFQILIDDNLATYVRTVDKMLYRGLLF